MFQIDGNFLSLLEVLQHLQDPFVCVDVDGFRAFDGLPWNRLGLFVDSVGVFRLEDFGLVRMLISDLSVSITEK